MSTIEGLTPAIGTTFTQIALVIFVVVFLGIMAWVMFSRSDSFKSSARIPLDDEVIVSPRDSGSLNVPVKPQAASPEPGNDS
ncbi:MAG: cbb3-type cytochrome c oxidase subunit 3 [Planctomycetota bacterium]|nr:cbb3-type cytochrome c oxidase subunit 3 [Planctomycetota bacterium]